MAKGKSPYREREIILGLPAKRPYGVRVSFRVQTAGALGYVEEVVVPLPSGAFLSLNHGRLAPWEGGKRYVGTLEGFPTAAAAEAAGRRVVQALLWMAVSLDSPLKLDYQSYEPAAVFERMRSEGARVEAYGEVGWNPNVVLSAIHDAYASLPEPDPKVLLSMEIFCASGLETSQRARFLTLVSALEPLADNRPLGPEVAAFVDQCLAVLKANSSIGSDARKSLEGRLAQLKEESIRQALRRFTRERLRDDTEAADIVDEAYALRSQIIHTGSPADLDVDLEIEGRSVSRVIRKIYASLLCARLHRPAC